MALANEENLSDDEIFIGKLTIKEIKKHIMMGRSGCANVHPKEEKNLSIANTFDIKKEDQDSSFKIIQTHSQPNLITDPSCPKSRQSDASFLEMEDFVEKLCHSPKKAESCEKLDNTFEFVEYILKHGPCSIKENKNMKNETKAILKVEREEEPKLLELKDDNTTTKVLPPINTAKIKMDKSNANTNISPVKKEKQIPRSDKFQTPSSSTKTKPVFKTPMNTITMSRKKATPMSIKKANFDIPKYQDIMSPVAAYIKNSPQAPLIQNVSCKKTLTGLSLIPKPGKSIKTENKENIKLPLTAYKSAKETKLIDLPEDKKMPKSSTKISTFIPKPMIIKHTHREMTLKKSMSTNMEDSFANLSCQQAEVSVCTQKSAYKMNKM